MSNMSDDDIKEAADLILEIEKESISEKLNSQTSRIEAYAKKKVDTDAVDQILNDVLGWNKR